MLHPYEKKLYDIVELYNDIVILTAETRFNIRNLENHIGNRFIDFGIAEQTMVGAGAGLSKMGKLPIMHALASFLTMRPYEFIRTDFGIPSLRGIFMGSFNGFMSTGNGPTHQAIEDISLMNNVPNMKIYSSSSMRETEYFLDNIDEVDSPYYVRYNNSNWDADIPRNFQFGKIDKLLEGDELIVISHSNCFEQCYIAASSIADNHNKFISLINCPSIKPLDKSILDEIDKFSTAIIVEDHFKIGSLFSYISDMVYEYKISTKIKAKNLNQSFFKPLAYDSVLKYEKFDSVSLEKLFLKELK